MSDTVDGGNLRQHPKEPSGLALVFALVACAFLLATMAAFVADKVTWALAGTCVSLVLLVVFRWAVVPSPPRKHEPWWAWHWDRGDFEHVPVTYDRVTRWRRGSFVTLYRLVGVRSTEWRLYLPFNASVGIQLDKE